MIKVLSWTPEELAEMERFDRSLEQTFRLTKEERRFSRRVDGVARLERLEDQSLQRDSARLKRQRLHT